ncbi:MAG: hypothetical protein CFE24_00230 [Flavobacterium sp. BFFFF2]|nr:MAG: hypothetical protein CFE24_00230 [Flavobacterium sp. BFFFF2]
MFVLNPDPYSTPVYRIGTFVTQSIARNSKLEASWSEVAINYLNQRFGSDNWILTINGREAMALAMQSLNLSKTANTTILTPSNNFYISGCVTSTIEKYCHWNREKGDQSDAYFVNHEFGYLYQDMEALTKENIPIIEDCCTTFFSQNENKKIGKYGDFSVYSFSKFFSIQIGGLLVSNKEKITDKLRHASQLTEQEKHYILKVIGFEISMKDEILAQRNTIWQYATKQYQEFGFSLRFPSEKDVIPSLILLNNHGIIKDLVAHKDYLNKHGIQNSVFYGEDAFFVPCHQNLNETDVDYIFSVTKNYKLNHDSK